MCIRDSYYTEYCDGKTVSCPGMKQWGTVTLANQGRNALSILQYYYGNNIEIVRTNNIQDVYKRQLFTSFLFSIAYAIKSNAAPFSVPQGFSYGYFIYFSF